jgi:threonine dehydrogenase-like Zn-dependent dehydrogenase
MSYLPIRISDLELVGDETVDIILFGADAELTRTLFPKLAKGGLVNLVLCGQALRPTGDVTRGSSPLRRRPHHRHSPDPIQPQGYAVRFQPTGEIKDRQCIHVIGAAGPMGTMHVMRDLCQGVPGVSVIGGDMNDERLAQLERFPNPWLDAHRRAFANLSTPRKPGPRRATVRLHRADGPGPRAGRPQCFQQPRPGDHQYLRRHPGHRDSSPSTFNTLVSEAGVLHRHQRQHLEDMRIVLKKVTARSLDTNLSVAAISGLDGAIDGIRAVEKQLIAGKILVYPCAAA